MRVNHRRELNAGATIRILIADRHPAIRGGLREALSLQPDFDVTAAAADGNGVMEMLEDIEPDVLLLDVHMPNVAGLPAVRAIAERNAQTKVILLTGGPVAPALIVNSIRSLHAGGRALNGSRASRPLQDRDRSPLTRREREIVRLVAQGYRNRDLSQKMLIAEQTVKNHLRNIFEKLGVSDRLQLAIYAVHKGLHQDTDPMSRPAD